MKNRFRFVRCIVTCFALTIGLAAPPTVHSQEKEPAAPKPIRVLFIGNSQIFYNDLPRMLQTISESAAADRPRIQVERSLAGGASLESHWNRGEGKGTSRARIAEEKWDFVILQDIYNVKRESFMKYARLYHDLIRQGDSQTFSSARRVSALCTRKDLRSCTRCMSRWAKS